ncbi:hypothetical protein ABZ784_29395 [Streptomyces tendae]|uniref:hypothetical protein n=1 Tax=Streptomyces tendae TaxID=1932 RepID=UPI003407C3D8
MAKYNVPLTGWANITVTVETDETDPEKIVELAQDEAGASLCHHCASQTNNSLDLGDEWTACRDPKTGTVEVYKETDA